MKMKRDSARAHKTRFMPAAACLALAAVLSACGSGEAGKDGGTVDAAASCKPSTSAVCDGETVVTCPGGIEVRTPCEGNAFCNYGACMPSTITMPADASPHNEESEWWYYTGHIKTASGKPFGFQVTIFQYLFESSQNKGYMCHVAVTDETALNHEFTQGITLEPTKWRSKPPLLEVLDCRIEVGETGDHIYGRIPTADDASKDLYVIDLKVKGLKRPAYHGNDGIIPMASTGETSYYYSYTRMSADGTLKLPDGTVESAAGIAWMDHQWGAFSIGSFKGWDWWSMQFDDGYEIMLFLFRDLSDVIVEKAGTIFDPQGQATWFEGLDAFELTPLSHWLSPHTKGNYPQNWDITIPEMNWTLHMTTAVPDQEMVNPAKIYWEGSVVVNGKRGTTDVSGVGYVELTGYAKNVIW